MPKGEAGDKLTFKALQTYDDGDVVRWIGPEDGDEPAPTVTLTGAASGGGHGAPGTDPDTAVSSDDAAAAQETGATATVTETVDATGDDGTDGLAIAALVVAVLALVAGIAAFVTARRTKGTR